VNQGDAICGLLRRKRHWLFYILPTTEKAAMPNFLNWWHPQDAERESQYRKALLTPGWSSRTGPQNWGCQTSFYVEWERDLFDNALRVKHRGTFEEDEEVTVRRKDFKCDCKTTRFWFSSGLQVGPYCCLWQGSLVYRATTIPWPEESGAEKKMKSEVGNIFGFQFSESQNLTPAYTPQIFGTPQWRIV